MSSKIFHWWVVLRIFANRPVELVVPSLNIVTIDMMYYTLMSQLKNVLAHSWFHYYQSIEAVLQWLDVRCCVSRVTAAPCIPYLPSDSVVNIIRCPVSRILCYDSLLLHAMHQDSDIYSSGVRSYIYINILLCHEMFPKFKWI